MEKINEIKKFFFPNDRKLKIEAKTDVSYDSKTRELSIHREFYTFRALCSFVFFAIKQPFIRQKENLNFILTYNRISLIRGAIAFDATGNSKGATSPITFAFTTTGNNRALTLGVAYGNAPSTPATYAGVNLDAGGTDASNEALKMWYKLNPTTGSNNIVVTMDFNNDTTIGAISFSEADQSSLDGTAVTNNGNLVSSLSTNYTTNFNNSFIVDCFCIGAGSPPTVVAGGSQTEKYNILQTTVRGGGSIQKKVTAGTTSMSWSWTGNYFPQQVVIAVKEKISDYVLTASQGSFSLTGEDATFTSHIANITMSAVQASFSLTLESADLLGILRITATQATFNLTGNSATLTSHPRFIKEPLQTNSFTKEPLANT